MVACLSLCERHFIQMLTCSDGISVWLTVDLLLSVLKQQLKLLLCAVQVLGDRDLLEHEVVGQLAKRNSATPDYLHVFVKLADVTSVSLDNEVNHRLAFDTADSFARNMSPRSALTHLLASATPVKTPGKDDR